MIHGKNAKQMIVIDVWYISDEYVRVYYLYRIYKKIFCSQLKFGNKNTDTLNAFYHIGQPVDRLII